MHDAWAVAFSFLAAAVLNRWFGIGLLGIGVLAYTIPLWRIRVGLVHPRTQPNEP